MYLCSKLVSNYRLYKGMRIVIQLKNIRVYDITFHNIQYNYRYYSWILKHVIYTVILWVMSFNVLMYTFYGFYVACTCMISWWLLYYMCMCSKLSFYSCILLWLTWSFLTCLLQDAVKEALKTLSGVSGVVITLVLIVMVSSATELIRYRVFQKLLTRFDQRFVI